jgi:hypothetical protein
VHGSELTPKRAREIIAAFSAEVITAHPEIVRARFVDGAGEVRIEVTVESAPIPELPETFQGLPLICVEVTASIVG